MKVSLSFGYNSDGEGFIFADFAPGSKGLDFLH